MTALSYVEPSPVIYRTFETLS